MYLNQFTNTKKFCPSSELAHDKRLQWIHVRENQKIPSNSFSSTKMTWDILFITLSASKMSSNKVYNTKKEKEKKKITVPQLFWLYSISTFAEVFTQI